MNKHIALVALLASLAPTLAHAQTIKPALTRDVDRPTAQPVYAECDADSTIFGSCQLYTVPAGKTLVVEVVTTGGFTTNSSSNGNVLQWQLYDQKTTYFLDVPVVRERNAGLLVYSGNSKGPYYFYQGSTITSRVQANSLGAQKSSFSGYLVNNN